MGSIRLGIDIDKVLELRDRFNIRAFVESGTYKGGTCTQAAQHFDRVITMEAYRPRFEKTTAQLAGQYPNLSFWYGDSRVLMSKALRELDQPCIIWADAHWVGDAATAFEIGDECPLREELEAVNASQYAAQHVILIDDARLFTAPPPYPHDPAQWLTYAEIQELLKGREVFMEDDVIYGLPT